MSSRTAAARKRLQHPPPKVSPTERSVNQPNSITTTTRADLVSSTPHSRDVSTSHTVQQLDLSNEFTQPLPSPEYSPTYFPPSNHVHFIDTESSQTVETVPSYGPTLHAQSNHRKAKWTASGQVLHTVPTYEPSSFYKEDVHQSRRPVLRVDPYLVKYQNLPLPPPPSLEVPSPNSHATGSFPYVPNSPASASPKYSPSFVNKHSDHLSVSYVQHSPSAPRSNRHSLAASDLPEYRSTCSTHMDSHIPVAITHKSTRRDDQHTSYQYPSTSRSRPPSPHAQPAAISMSQLRNENRFPIQYLPSVPNPLKHSFSNSNLGSERITHDPRRHSASLSYYSALSGSPPTTPTSNGTWQPPPPPPSPNFFFPGSRSVARPRVTSKITMSQLSKRRSKSRLRVRRSLTSLVPPLSPISTSVETSPVSPIIQTPIQSNHPDIWGEESTFAHSDDYQRQVAPPIVPKAPPENFVFPTARSRAQPKPKSSSHSSKNKDNSGGSRFIGTLFKKKNKGKTPNITPPYPTLSDSMASAVEHTAPQGRILEGDEYTVHHEQTKKFLKSGRSYPLDPYNSVLLDNDRHTGELLSRLNRTGTPSFHDYGNSPPSSVLDLGCGQGHWVLEAAIAWKAYGTHVIGYDMVDISRNLLPWAAEQGVRDNIRFVRGNFLKQQLPFSSDTFDLVRMSCLALCITSDSWGFILQEVCRVLVAGGRLEFIDDQIFFPYSKVSSLMDIDDGDANSMVESVAPKVDSVLSPTVSTYSIYGEFLANPGLGSTVGHRGSDDDDEDYRGSDHEDSGTVLHDHKGKVTAGESSTAQPRVKPSIVLSPEDWDRSLSISEDLEALFEHMLLETFDIHKDPSDFILSLMTKVFGQAREVETMNIVLAPPDITAKSGRLPEQSLSHCPGLILWPSTFIPMDHTEVEIHASKHLRTLLSCKNFLTQHAIEVAEDERVDEEFVSEALWEYESFLRHRFNSPVSYEEVFEGEDSTSIRNSIVESSSGSVYSESFEAMLEIQSEFRRRYAWQPERPPTTTSTIKTRDSLIVKTPSPPVSSPSTAVHGSSGMPYDVTHVRTFRVFEAVKLDNYILTYDSY